MIRQFINKILRELLVADIISSLDDELESAYSGPSIAHYWMSNNGQR